jgi:hypothetical protein
MRGLIEAPTFASLERAYAALQSSTAISAEELGLWSQWSRFDPRLAELFVAFLAARWKTADWVSLRGVLETQPWPTAFGVLAENALAGNLLPRSERSMFRRWNATILTGLARGRNELFFFGTRKIGGREMFRDAAESAVTYLRWGYLGRDLLVSKANPRAFASRGKTLVPAPARKRLLDELARTRTRFTIGDYQSALDYGVSRRQAELDLARHPGIVGVGNTRARFYRRR